MDDIRHPLPRKPERFMDQLRHHIRQNGLAYRTEQTYVHWIKRFIHFNDLRHPNEMGEADIEGFLSFLASQRFCSVNTQRIALNALVYLYKRFLGKDINLLNFNPAKQHRRLPVVYSREEIKAILDHLQGIHHLQVALMYGSGLRSAELLSLRVKDIDFGSNNIFVRGGKGNKDRTTMLPQGLISSLKRQIGRVALLHQQDLLDGYGRVYLPDALERKYPRAGSTCSRPTLSGVVLGPVCGADTIRTRPRLLARSEPRCGRRVSTSRRVRMHFATALPLTCWRRAMIFALSRNCSDTRISVLRRSIPMW